MARKKNQWLTGILFFGVVSALSLGGAYALWPPNFLDTPFGQMSFGMLLRSAVSAVLAVIGLEFLGGAVFVALSDGREL